jgi:hypothetical protein
MYFLRGKGGRCVRLTLPPSCAVVMKSGNLNFLEPSGSLQACNGAALTLPLPLLYVHILWENSIKIDELSGSIKCEQLLYQLRN